MYLLISANGCDKNTRASSLLFPLSVHWIFEPVKNCNSFSHSTTLRQVFISAFCVPAVVLVGKHVCLCSVSSNDDLHGSRCRTEIPTSCSLHFSNIPCEMYG